MKSPALTQVTRSCWAFSTGIVLSSVLPLAADATDPKPDSTRPAAQRPALRGDRSLGALALFDTNHDGIISAAEIATATTRLRQSDRNQDNTLSAQELQSPRTLPSPNSPQTPH